MTTFETQLTKELADTRAYIAEHDMADDDMAKRMLADIEAKLAAEAARPRKYITATCSQDLPGEVIDKYLGFGAMVNMFLAAKRTTIAIIEVPAEHATWQSMRLASGLLGGHVYDDFAGALADARELQAFAS